VIHTDIGEEEMQVDQKESGPIASKKCNMPQRSQTLHNWKRVFMQNMSYIMLSAKPSY